MVTMTQNPRPFWRRNLWRILGWGCAAALILTPLVAMQFTDEVHWTGSDFLFAIIVFGTVGLLFELSVRLFPDYFYRAGMGCALLASFMIVWANAAVGMIGNEDNPINLLFFGVVLIALTGAIIARFRAQGMALAMLVALITQISIATIFGLLGGDPRGGIFSILLSILWLLAAALFKASRR
ncbi:MAG: hypothetical protein IPP23_09330 [Sphingomonadales bacterium]|nr:hypothetical protein [Sphingomonadales bacterium]